MKKLFALCTALFLLLLSLPVLANDASLPRVIDDADLLTEREEALLLEGIGRLQALGYDAVLLTMDESFGGKTEEEYADDYYDDHGYGVGEDNSGFLFLVNMAERRLYISTCGRGIGVLTDYGRELLFDRITGSFSDGDYYTGFSLFLSQLENQYIPAYDRGEPIDFRGVEPSNPYYPGENDPWADPEPARLTAGAVAICCLIGFGISLMIFLGVKKGMKTARVARSADASLRQESFHLTNQSDTFLYSRTQRIPRNTNNNSGKSGGGGGGSFTHTSSGGVSHGGGGRSF